MLEMAVLGLLHREPMHGYELRKRLHETFGDFRAFSCGTVYPTLRRMLRAGLIAEDAGPDAPERARRGRRVYRLTDRGGERFAELVADCGPRACSDDAFDVRLAFFARTPPRTRMRILEGRRRRVEQRCDRLRAALERVDPDDERPDNDRSGSERFGRDRSEGGRSEGGRSDRGGAECDRYTTELHRLGLENSEREVRWLDELISHERAERD